MTLASGLHFSLLDEALIRYRRASDGETVNASLPQLLAALAADEVRDYPALRPHQRHPWHAFLVQLAAIALHKAARNYAFTSAAEWRATLLALTPRDPDGAAWCLVSPPQRPALLQAPVAGGSTDTWKSWSYAADEIDMLVTSKNHDLKACRARRSRPEDWLFALLSLQTQEGFLGAGNYGISRMNGGFASRSGVGIAAVGLPGGRWWRDVAALLAQRARTVETWGLQEADGLALVWLEPWDGADSLSFKRLDPFYIEICRRIRLFESGDRIMALGTGSKEARIASEQLKGMTGDAWTPINVENAKALTITDSGFNYKLVSDLLYGGTYQLPAAYQLSKSATESTLTFVAQGVTRGKGKTEGYHERRVPISAKARGLMVSNQKDQLERLAKRRMAAIIEVRKLLWLALTVLFSNGKSGSGEGHKAKANQFADPFEQAEDARFFDDLNEELEASDPVAQHLQWLLGLAERADTLLRTAFDAGPRSAVQKYRAQSSALSRFHGGLRSPKSPLPALANYYRQKSLQHQEDSRDHE